jgi:hypothetical protein
MPPTNISKIPQNQLDALPLTDAATAAAGGDIVVLGNTISRYWSPTVTGINGTPFANDANGFPVIVSNFLDVRGCRTFTMLMRRAFVGVGIALANFSAFAQYRFSTGETPLTSLGATQNAQLLAMNLLGNCNNPLTFGAFQNANEVQTIAIPFDLGQETSTGNNGPKIVGTDVRIVFVATGAIAATNTFFLAMWGQ